MGAARSSERLQLPAECVAQVSLTVPGGKGPRATVRLGPIPPALGGGLLGLEGNGRLSGGSTAPGGSAAEGLCCVSLGPHR